MFIWNLRLTGGPGESQGWGAWWAAIYRVTQSQTWLKWLSRGSCILSVLQPPDHPLLPPPLDWLITRAGARTDSPCLYGRHLMCTFDRWNSLERANVIIHSSSTREKKIFFGLFIFVVGYNQLTMLWWFQVNSEGTQPNIYKYPFFPKLPSHPGCQATLSSVPCTIQWVLGGYPY